MSDCFVVLNASFGGSWSRALGCQVAAPTVDIHSAFLRRLRSFGYERFFLNADVHRTPFMDDAAYRTAVASAEAFVRSSGLPGTVSEFPDARVTDEFERKQAAEWIRDLNLDDDTVVLSIESRALFFGADELSRLVAHVPPGQSTLYTTGGVLPWETACAYRFRYEREVRLVGGPVASATIDSSALQAAPIPFSIRFEPNAAFDEVITELIQIGAGRPDGNWQRSDLEAIWKTKPELFRRHISHVGVELTNDDNLPSRLRSPRTLAPKRPVGRMDAATWRKILADLPRGPLPVSIDLWDFGEPLLHPEAVEWIAEAAAAGFRVDLRTNALAIDDATADRLVKSGVDAVFVRLDAASTETYGRVSGAAARYHDATAGLARLIAAKKTLPANDDGARKPILAVEMTEMAETRDDVDAFFERYDHKAAIGTELRNRLVREASDAEVLAELYKTRDPIEHAIYRHDNLYRGRISRPAESTWTPLHRFPCRQLLEGPYILWDGAIVPCREDVEAEMVVGHVRDGLMNAWRGAALREIHRFHESGCSAKDHFCSTCGEWYYPFT